MTISQALKANILRYHHVEKWRVGTIASQLGVHHSTVKRVLSETGVTKDTILVQKSMIDPFVPFILEQLKRFPQSDRQSPVWHGRGTRIPRWGRSFSVTDFILSTKITG